MEEKQTFYDAVYALVSMVPKGKVCTYGRIAAMLGSPRAARAVGYALFQLRYDRHPHVPWQRIVNASGTISSKGDVIRAEEQLRLLKGEGIVLDGEDRIPLEKYLWQGPELGGGSKS